MASSFVSRFLLPLVKGGPMEIRRPLGKRALGLIRARAASGAEEEAIAELASRRHALGLALVPDPRPPALDDATLRLGIAVHNLLALGHPAFQGRRGLRRQERIAEVTLPLADLGPPATADEAVERHTILGRLAEIVRD